ncbi:lengsin [Megalops cyprinoides]|uniref:lengsin n=1 Tax=Megalops cyprinoides TaxID=118141 RepID=UPI001863C9AA|nr:lengsin [Megalops cyprinoides]
MCQPVSDSVNAFQETSDTKKDQIDGTSLSLRQKKGVKVCGKYITPMDSEREEPSVPIGQAYVSAQHPSDTLVSLESPLRRPSGSPQICQLEDPSKLENEDWNREDAVQTGVSCTHASIPKQTLEDVRTLLRESSLLSIQGKEGDKPGSAYSYVHMIKPDSQQEEDTNKCFTTFKPHAGFHKESLSKDIPTSPQPTSNSESPRSYTFDVSVTRPSNSRHLTADSATWTEDLMSQTDSGKDTKTDTHGSQSFSPYTSAIGHIKQRIAQADISFVRFEATDLHGVSRSKTVPARLFQEKAVHGVTMPRSYLELTLSPKDNEVDHVSAANFNSDVLLIPDLPTFRILPWANQTARVICDSCSVTGHPLCTSPRLIAKQLLGQLQSLGFSLHSSFTYECCVFGVPERINSKTLLFPAATLLSNHDLPFFQQLVSSMYYMGAEVDSFASASGPGQMEISFQPEFGIGAADNAFTFRTGIKEMARKHGYIASFFTNDGFHNCGVLSHSLWDVNERRNLFYSDGGELSEIGRKWMAGLLHHSAALSCMLAPGVGCRRQIAKDVKDPKCALYATCGYNDNNCTFNIKSHGAMGMRIDNKLGSAMANPYLVMAATVAAGLDGIKHNLTVDMGPNRSLTEQRKFAIPVKLEDALAALEEDHIIRGALGNSFVQYFIAMKRYEIETQEMDAERNKCLEYFI